MSLSSGVMCPVCSAIPARLPNISPVQSDFQIQTPPVTCYPAPEGVTVSRIMASWVSINFMFRPLFHSSRESHAEEHFLLPRVLSLWKQTFLKSTSAHRNLDGPIFFHSLVKTFFIPCPAGSCHPLSLFLIARSSVILQPTPPNCPHCHHAFSCSLLWPNQVELVRSTPAVFRVSHSSCSLEVLWMSAINQVPMRSPSDPKSGHLYLHPKIYSPLT